LRGHRAVRPHGGDQDDLLGDGVEHRHDGGARQDGVREVERIGIDARQTLGEPDHVIAHDAKDAAGHGRQAGGNLHAGLGDEVAQRFQSAGALGDEGA
jgi:hypothetical protein